MGGSDGDGLDSDVLSNMKYSFLNIKVFVSFLCMVLLLEYLHEIVPFFQKQN